MIGRVPRVLSDDQRQAFYADVFEVVRLTADEATENTKQHQTGLVLGLCKGRKGDVQMMRCR